MGEAKRRKAEIEALKQNSSMDAGAWRQLQQDKRRLALGINPETQNPEDVAALARVLYHLFEEAKRIGSINAPVEFFQSTVNSTVHGLADIPVACKKGCSHCCHTWVSVSVPEILSIANIVRVRGEATVEKVKLTNEQTKDYDFDTRDLHPHACPLLAHDLCTIYDSRPMTCRMAASGDAEICARTYHNITAEDVPMPLMHMVSRTGFSLSLSGALRKANLRYRTYELNAGLTHALNTSDAEQRWLSGEDVFAGVLSEPNDVFSNPPAEAFYHRVFGA